MTHPRALIDRWWACTVSRKWRPQSKFTGKLTIVDSIWACAASRLCRAANMMSFTIWNEHHLRARGKYHVPAPQSDSLRLYTYGRHHDACSSLLDGHMTSTFLLHIVDFGSWGAHMLGGSSCAVKASGYLSGAQIWLAESSKIVKASLTAVLAWIYHERGWGMCLGLWRSVHTPWCCRCVIWCCLGALMTSFLGTVKSVNGQKLILTFKIYRSWVYTSASYL